MSIYSSSTTTPDLDSYEDRTGKFEFDGLSFSVKVVKARLRFGHLDLLVSPISGEGERWVEQHRVNLDEQEAAIRILGLLDDKEELVHSDFGQLGDLSVSVIA